MPSLNKVILIGHVGNEPELKYTTNNNAVCNFSVATTKSWKNHKDEWQEKVEWHSVVVWRKQAEYVAKNIEKGSLVYVEGEIETRSWEQDGERKYKTEVVVYKVMALTKKQSVATKPDPPDAPALAPKVFSQDDAEHVPGIGDNDLPF